MSGQAFWETVKDLQLQSEHATRKIQNCRRTFLCYSHSPPLTCIVVSWSVKGSSSAPSCLPQNKLDDRNPYAKFPPTWGLTEDWCPFHYPLNLNWKSRWGGSLQLQRDLYMWGQGQGVTGGDTRLDHVEHFRATGVDLGDSKAFKNSRKFPRTRVIHGQLHCWLRSELSCRWHCSLWQKVKKKN